MLPDFCSKVYEQNCELAISACKHFLENLGHYIPGSAKYNATKEVAYSACYGIMEECPKFILHRYPLASLAVAAVTGAVIYGVGRNVVNFCRRRCC